MQNNQQQQLKEEFHRTEANYVAALNHSNGFTGSASELWQLRTAMEAAKRACEEAGIPVRTVEEWAKQERAKNEQWLRAAAERIPHKNSALMHLARLAIPIAIGSGLAMSLRYSCSTGWSLSLAYIAGLFVYAFVYDVWPTPWMRLGRQAAERLVHLHLWEDTRQREFNCGWQMDMRRMKKELIRVY
jgi:hypothetical protein